MAWFEKITEESDVILGTKVTLSRNIKGFPFPVKMSLGDKENAMGMIRQASGGMNLSFIRNDEMDDNARKDLYEQYFIGKPFGDGTDKNGILKSGRNEGLAVLINDNDHLTIMSFEAGSDVREAFGKASEVAVLFEKSMDIAFSDKFGFLTSDVRNIGTGARIYFFVSLPGIEMTKGAVAVLSQRVSKYEWQVSPCINAAGGREGGLYVLSNIATLGITEEDLVRRAEMIAKDVIMLERSCRDNIYKKKKTIVDDQYYRAYAILKYARRLESTESLGLLNWLRLGYGRIEDDETNIDEKKINLLTHKIRRDFADYDDRRLKAPERAAQRAKMVREVLKGDD